MGRGIPTFSRFALVASAGRPYGQLLSLNRKSLKAYIPKGALWNSGISSNAWSSTGLLKSSLVDEPAIRINNLWAFVLLLNGSGLTNVLPLLNYSF